MVNYRAGVAYVVPIFKDILLLTRTFIDTWRHETKNMVVYVIFLFAGLCHSQYIHITTNEMLTIGFIMQLNLQIIHEEYLIYYYCI